MNYKVYMFNGDCVAQFVCVRDAIEFASNSPSLYVVRAIDGYIMHGKIAA